MKTTEQAVQFRQYSQLLLGMVITGWQAVPYADRTDAPLEEMVRTEMVFPNDKGEIQVNVRLEYDRPPEGGHHWKTPIALEYGLTDRLQVELEWGGYQRIRENGEDREGVGNVSVALQYSWLNIANAGVHAAAGAEYEFASGDAEVMLADEDDADAERKNAYELYLTLAKDLDSSADKQILLQFGMEHEQDEDYLFANLAGYTKVGRNLVASLEYNWHEEGAERYISPQLAWKAGDSWEIGLGASIGAHHDADDYRIIGRLSLEWE